MDKTNINKTRYRKPIEIILRIIIGLICVAIIGSTQPIPAISPIALEK